ncbi:MAG: hypothetical protein KDD55_03250 [Bdellovibrionales bacterium]|nr:hypothetical protein [Bdellovibrionales bacterium]
MGFSREYLKCCEKLSYLGYAPPLERGGLVGRGFADIGSEVFSVLSDPLHEELRVVSLLTGEVTTLPLSEREKLFVLPQADDMLREIDRLGWDVSSLTFDRLSGWTICVVNEEIEYCLSHERIDLLLLELLLTLYGAG